MGLTITAIEAIPVSAKRTKPMISAGGMTPLRVSEFGIVRVRTSDGVEGIGEISMNGGRTGAIQCDDVNRILGPALLGCDPTQLNEAIVRMDRALPWPATEPSKAAVEMALFDITGKVRGLPAYELLGGRIRDRVHLRWGLAFGHRTTGSRKRGSRGPGVPDDQDQDRSAGHRPRRGDGRGGRGPAWATPSTSWSTPTPGIERRRRPSRSCASSSPIASSWWSSPSPDATFGDLAWVRGTIDTPILADESMRHWSEAFDIARHEAADVLAIYVSEAGGMLGGHEGCGDR